MGLLVAKEASSDELVLFNKPDLALRIFRKLARLDRKTKDK